MCVISRIERFFFLRLLYILHVNFQWFVVVDELIDFTSVINSIRLMDITPSDHFNGHLTRIIWRRYRQREWENHKVIQLNLNFCVFFCDSNFNWQRIFDELFSLWFSIGKWSNYRKRPTHAPWQYDKSIFVWSNNGQRRKINLLLLLLSNQFRIRFHRIRKITEYIFTSDFFIISRHSIPIDQRRALQNHLKNFVCGLLMHIYIFVVEFRIVLSMNGSRAINNSWYSTWIRSKSRFNWISYFFMIFFPVLLLLLRWDRVEDEQTVLCTIRSTS